jgi:hypothetical protein
MQDMSTQLQQLQDDMHAEIDAVCMAHSDVCHDVKNAYGAVSRISNELSSWMKPLQGELAGMRVSYEQHNSLKQSLQNRTEAAEERQRVVRTPFRCS